MKYKIIGIAACAVALVVSIMAPVVLSHEEQRVHQHRSAEEKAPCSHTDDTFCTHLPLVSISTGGTAIPGLPIRDENGDFVTDENGNATAFTTTADGATSLRASMEIRDSATNNNHTTDTPAVSSDITIHVRGNSSRFFDKSSYAITSVTPEGENNDISVMGMDAHHQWVLYGPYLDKTMIRNYMWYNIGGEIMGYAPNVRFCEVMIDGEYAGLYLMTETVTAGKDGARLDISSSKKHQTFTGYVLRLDRGGNLPMKNISTFTSYTLRTKQQLDIVYPGTSTLTPQLAADISEDFSDFEKALYSYDYDSPQFGYPAMIDSDSFVDYFILNEVTCNYDAGWLSTYIYKEMDGKYRVCLWDFNNSCDNYKNSQTDTMMFSMQNSLWYYMLMKDENFTGQIISRYRELRQTYLSDDYLNSYIDDTVAYLGDAIRRNNERWASVYTEEKDMLTPADRNPRTYAAALEQLNEFLQMRLGWMDENIETLRQFSAESGVKKFNDSAN